MHAIVYYRTAAGEPDSEEFTDIDDIRLRPEGLYAINRKGQVKTVYNTNSWVSADILEHDEGV